MCHLCARDNDGEPDLRAEKMFGVPLLKQVGMIDENTGYLAIGIPKDAEIPAPMKANIERRVNEAFDKIDDMTDQTGSSDIAMTGIALAMAEKISGFDASDASEYGRAAAMMIASFAVEGARLRREVRKLTEGLFDPFTGPLVDENAPEGGKGWEAPPPWA